MLLPAVVDQLIDSFKQRKPQQTKSLVVTFFGDIVSQHDGTIWLGSLIPALARFGINERLVRTTVFRLAQEDWLEAERVGRRSYYKFSSYGEHEYERAAKRIYSLQEVGWDGQWQLVLPINVADDVRDRLLRSLRWQGYRNITPGVLAKPSLGGAELVETLLEFEVTDDVLVMASTTPEITSPALVSDMVYKSWKLDDVASGYVDFLNRFTPVFDWLDKESALDPESAYLIRLMLIQDYRRLLLQDTPIPVELLPRSWPGIEARQMSAQIYHQIADASVEFITGNLEGKDGHFPTAAAGFADRFVGTMAS